ncbi:hypothetical protein P4O66_019874 [Electrophorus voltai]|uniref:Tyrosine-protein kinase n=1 Tax=Electrophorus voltai TaxID=2609070 RepID=A0AAD8ZYF8_9TELE|nr:hypothetical protein P4O66_019874 [Electrophorus voltai]
MDLRARVVACCRAMCRCFREKPAQPSNQKVDIVVIRPAPVESLHGLPPVRMAGNVYIALYDYRARTAEDLSFNAGDTLEALDTSSGDWWRARALTGLSASKQGYIPANYVALVESLDAEPWYFAGVKRLDAEKLLLSGENQDGAFLIRQCESQAGELSLSVLDQGSVKHYKIKRLDNGQYYVSRTQTFPALRDLVQHYSQNDSGLCIRLALPCKKDFLREAQIMKKLRHPKLIQLYAVCTVEEPIYIITELMSNGSLLEYLQKDKGQCLQVSDQIEMAAQVASGMAYLELQNYIHRDLAARNVLVGDNNVVKVADFGLARVFLKDENVYEPREGTKFPVKWTSPEAIHDNKFSIKSDVWSFGILLYEIMTFGQMPYPALTNYQVVQKLRTGYRMPRPARCPTVLYDIMLECWKDVPSDRPTFETLQWKLEDFFDLDINSYDDANRY